MFLIAATFEPLVLEMLFDTREAAEAYIAKFLNPGYEVIEPRVWTLAMVEEAR